MKISPQQESFEGARTAPFNWYAIVAVSRCTVSVFFTHHTVSSERCRGLTELYNE